MDKSSLMYIVVYVFINFISMKIYSSNEQIKKPIVELNLEIFSKGEISRL